MASQPAKRVRTGCLKCRVRRRKCDEGKPRCQRCITGGFECQYGTRLSFLDKNAFTVDEASAPAKETAPISGYRKVQFVDDDAPSASSPQEERQTQALRSHVPPIELTFQPQARTSESTAKKSRSSVHQVPDQIDVDSHLSDLHDSGTPFTSWSPTALQTPQTSGGDQIALDALLSLGHEHTNVFVDRNVHRNSVNSVTFHDQGSNVFQDVFTSHENPVQETALSLAELPDSEHGTAEEFEYRLLKHYRYEVAPWLDICDLSQTFGMAVVCQAGESNIILRFIQELSELSMRSLSKSNLESSPNLLNREDLTFDAYTTEERLLCTSLSQAADAFRQVDQSQADGACNLLDAVHRLILDETTPVTVAAYHLMMRLELSKAFLQELPISKMIFHVPEMLPSQWHKTELAKQVFQYAHIPLLLCFRVLDFCWGEPSNSTGLAGDMVSRWRTLVDELNSWYNQRPQEFLSMVEIESADDGYPMVLFTSGAAVFGNQLYHTGMFLLLRHKPRTVILPSRHRSSTMSALWHARRICGIALNNERRECWDMSLVASLLVAARTMTHEAQHQALLAGIHKIERLTGWSLGTVKNTLKAEWGI